MTTYEHDDAGRLVRSVTTHDAEWTADDRRWALAWRLNEDLRCSGCGGNSDETTDEDYPYYYDVFPGAVCARCEALEHYRQSRRNRDDAPAGQSLRVVETPVRR